MAQIVVENNGGGMALAISLGVAAFLLALDVWSILEYWIRQKKEEWNVRRLYRASECQIYFQMGKIFPAFTADCIRNQLDSISYDAWYVLVNIFCNTLFDKHLLVTSLHWC